MVLKTRAHTQKKIGTIHFVLNCSALLPFLLVLSSSEYYTSRSSDELIVQADAYVLRTVVSLFLHFFVYFVIYRQQNYHYRCRSVHHLPSCSFRYLILFIKIALYKKKTRSVLLSVCLSIFLFCTVFIEEKDKN